MPVAYAAAECVGGEDRRLCHRRTASWPVDHRRYPPAPVDVGTATSSRRGSIVDYSSGGVGRLLEVINRITLLVQVSEE